MNIDIAVVDYAVYEGKTEYLGMSEASLPDIAFLTQEVAGAGISGKLTEIIPGYVEAMTLGLNFRTVTTEAITLLEQRNHTIELRATQAERNRVTREMEERAIKHVMSVFPKSLKLGKLAPASPADASGEYAVNYWKMTIDGKTVLEIDPYNFICIINGVDYRKTTRAALGK